MPTGIPLMFNWNIDVGNMLTIAAFLIGGIFFVAKVRGRVDTLSTRMLAVEGEVKQLVTVLIQQGRHEERMGAMDSRLAAQGLRLDQTIDRLNRALDEKRVE